MLNFIVGNGSSAWLSVRRQYDGLARQGPSRQGAQPVAGGGGAGRRRLHAAAHSAARAVRSPISACFACPVPGHRLQSAVRAGRCGGLRFLCGDGATLIMRARRWLMRCSSSLPPSWSVSAQASIIWLPTTTVCCLGAAIALAAMAWLSAILCSASASAQDCGCYRSSSSPDWAKLPLRSRSI